MKLAPSLLLTGTAALALVLTGCTDNPQSAQGSGESTGKASGSTGTTVNVTITDDACDVETASVPSGQVTFEITNKGTVPNELEVLAENQLQILSEQENIGPGTTATMTTALKEGSYYTACKPNMVGDFVGLAGFEVTPGEEVKISEDQAELESKAVENYTSYVKDQVGQLVTATQQFTDAYASENVEEAKRLYPLARQHYERIEPTAESFGIKEAGDLDAALDARVQDLALDAGKAPNDPEVLKQWTGWHRIEADLFTEEPAGFKFTNDQQRQQVIQQLNEDTQTLYDLVYGEIEGVDGAFSLELSDVVDGASGLLEEVATSKIVGEEETFSHTDLYDFQANVEGAQVAYGNVAELVRQQNPELADEIERRFAEVEKLILAQSTGKDAEGNLIFKPYDEIAAVQKDATGEVPSDAEYTEIQREFSNAVNALSEPLSKVAATILH